MNDRQKKSVDLYYRSILIPTPAALKFKKELKKINLTTHEAKKFLVCFEDWVKFIIFFKNNRDGELIKNFLLFTFSKNDFDYLDLKENNDNHPMLRVFNYFIRVRNGDFSCLIELINEVDYCEISDTYDFKWS